jgi:hypothetical protein
VQVAPGPDHYTVVVRRVLEHGVRRRIHLSPAITEQRKPPAGVPGVGDGPDIHSGVDGLHRGDLRGGTVSEPDHSGPRHESRIRSIVSTPRAFTSVDPTLRGSRVLLQPLLEDALAVLQTADAVAGAPQAAVLTEDGTHLGGQLITFFG